MAVQPGVVIMINYMISMVNLLAGSLMPSLTMITKKIFIIVFMIIMETVNRKIRGRLLLEVWILSYPGLHWAAIQD